MGILIWMLIRTIIFSMIGNSFYKWFAGTTWGIWFDMKMTSILDKVVRKEKLAQLKKPLKVAPKKKADK